MITLNLNKIKNYQQVPAVSLIPLKVLKDRIYFLKIIENFKKESWIDGIYCYYVNLDQTLRIDFGVQNKYPHKFDIYVPYDESDIAIYDELDYLFFSMIVKDEKNSDIVSLAIYAIDLETNDQINIYSIKYSQSEFYFTGFKMLSDTYMAVYLNNTVNDMLKHYNKIFIINVYTREILEVIDEHVKYSVGIMELSIDSENLFFEECYLDEDYETEILTTDLYEIDQDEVKNSSFNIFKNSIKYISLEKFREAERKGDKHVIMKEVDTVDQEAIIRVIGTTRENIYYKKSKHQKDLEFSKNFVDRVMLGKEEIYALNKNNLKLKKVTNLEIGAIFSFEDDIPIKVFDNPNSIKLIDIKTGITIYEYKKENMNEEYFNFYENRYLMIEIVNQKQTVDGYKVIDVKNDNQVIKAKQIRYLKKIFFIED